MASASSAASASSSNSNQTPRLSADVIKTFSGEGDVVAWMKKVTLVARLQGLKDLASLIPLFLEGNALALYLQLSDEEQKDIDIIQSKLETAFADDPFTAFSKLAVKKWTGEPVDVFATEIRRLAGLAKFTGTGLENLVKLTFINGFPDQVGVALQQMPNVLKLEMSDILDRARILTAKQVHPAEIAAVSVGAARVSTDNNNFKRDNDGASNQSQNRGPCFRCGGPHLIRNCREKVRCFKCNKFGHVASKCTEESSGN